MNGAAGQLNTFVSRGDRVEVDGERVAPQQPRLCAAPQAGRRRHDGARPARPADGRRARRHEARVVPVGRLDADTTGALLLTNDGQLAHRLAHPRYGVEKAYVAEVEGEPSEDALPPAGRGRRARGRPTAPAARAGWAPVRVELTLHEGRNHQVKRMLAAVGHPVQRLHRSGYAGLVSRISSPGDWRELTADEVARLASLALALMRRRPRRAGGLRRTTPRAPAQPTVGSARGGYVSTFSSLEPNVLGVSS